MEAQTLHLTKVEEIDFKGIREFALSPEGKRLILIRGPNGAGKSSALDCIVAVLGGARLDPPEPIRAGANHAEGTVTLGTPDAPDSVIAKVTWTRKQDGSIGRELTLAARTDKGLAAIPKPQTTLTGMIGTISTDPLALLKVDEPSKQARALMLAAGKAAEYDAAVALVKRAEQEATQANAEARAARNQIEAEGPAPATPPAEPPDAAEAAKQLDEALAHNKAVMESKVAAQTSAQKVQALAADRTRAEAQLAHINRELAAAEETASKAAAAIGQPIDIAPLQAQAATLHEKRSAFAAWTRRQKLAADYRAKLKAAEAAGDTLAARRDAVTSAARNVAGETFQGLEVALDGSLEVNGIPLIQLSKSERTRLSASVVMQQPRQIKLALIDDGDAMDPQSLAALVGVAERFDYQVLATAVYADGGPSLADVTKTVNLQPQPTQPSGSPKAPPTTQTADEFGDL